MTQLSSLRGETIARPNRIAIFLIVTLSCTAAIGALAARQPLLTLAALLAGCLAFAGLYWPDSPTLAALFILYLNIPVIAIRFHGVPTVLAAMAPSPLIIPLANYLIFRREKLILSWSMRLLFLYLLVQIVGTLFSRDLMVSFDALTTFIIEGIGLSFAFLNTVRTTTMVRRAAWTLLVAGALLGSLSIYQYVTKTYDNDYGGFAQVTGEGFQTGAETIQGAVEQLRLAGPIGEKNYYAQMMFLLVPLGLSLVGGERSNVGRALATGMTGLITLGAMLTYSRGLAVGFVIVLVIMILMGYVKPPQSFAILIAVLLLLELVPEFGVRLSTTLPIEQLLSGGTSTALAAADPATKGRLGEMGAALLVFLDHPFVGVGPGMFRYYYPEYIERVGLQLHAGVREAHNLYLGLAANGGLFGLGLFLAITGVTLYELNLTRRRWRKIRPDISHLAAGFMLAIMSYLATGFFLTLAYERYFWVMVALGSALASSAGAPTLSAAGSSAQPEAPETS